MKTSFLSKLKTFFLITEILKLKEILDYRGRISRETFVILNVVLIILYVIISMCFSSVFFILYVPKTLLDSLEIILFGCMTCAIIILWIKRLHDLNKPGWLSILSIHTLGYVVDLFFNLSTTDWFFWHFTLGQVIFEILKFVIFVYLCVTPGNLEKNKYGVSKKYKIPSSLFLFCCYLIIILQMVFMSYFLIGNNLYILRNWEVIKNNKLNKMDLDMYIVGERWSFLKGDYIQSYLEGRGVIFIDNNKSIDVVFITKNKILVRGDKNKQIVVQATLKSIKAEVFSLSKFFSKNTAIEEKLKGDSKANVTRLIVANASLQMFVFEIDKPIGEPAKLNSREKQALEEMNTF